MIVDHIEVRETLVLDSEAGIRRTADGYLVASPRVARTGIQIYAGSEVGKPQMDRVRVWRPEDEVFNKDAMASLAYRPITNDHPKEAVNAGNWKKYAAGQVGGDIARDGDFIRVPLVVMDGGTIQDIADGKREISLGYGANLEWRSGVTPMGEAYDAVQTSIRINHLAIVDAARGGNKLALGDRADDNKPAVRDEPIIPQTKDQQDMTTDTLRKITVDGIALQVSELAADVFQRALDTATKAADAFGKKEAMTAEELAAAKKKMEKDSADAIAALATKDAEIATLKKQLEDAAMTPAKLDSLVKDRGVVIAKAQAVLGDKLVVDGKDLADIRKQVVLAKMGDVAKAWDDNSVRVSFDTLTAGVEVKADGTGTANDAANRINNAFSGTNYNLQGQGDKREKALDAYAKHLEDAWKTPAGNG